MNDGYILWCLHVPIIMIFLLLAMICLHRRSVLKYLYLMDMFCYLVAIFSYFILTKYIVRKAFLTHWMDTVPLICLIGIFGGYFLFVVSVSAFVMEHARRHKWARVILGIIGFICMVLRICGVYLFIEVFCH